MSPLLFTRPSFLHIGWLAGLQKSPQYSTRLVCTVYTAYICVYYRLWPPLYPHFLFVHWVGINIREEVILCGWPSAIWFLRKRLYLTILLPWTDCTTVFDDFTGRGFLCPFIIIQQFSLGLFSLVGTCIFSLSCKASSRGYYYNPQVLWGETAVLHKLVTCAGTSAEVLQNFPTFCPLYWRV